MKGLAVMEFVFKIDEEIALPGLQKLTKTLKERGILGANNNEE